MASHLFSNACVESQFGRWQSWQFEWKQQFTMELFTEDILKQLCEKLWEGAHQVRDIKKSPDFKYIQEHG